MTEAIIFMLVLGAACGSLLSVASKIFYVYEDPRIAEVEGFLAGANCGGCGYTGCGAAAAAVVGGKAKPSVCMVGGPESAEEEHWLAILPMPPLLLFPPAEPAAVTPFLLLLLQLYV